MQMITKEEAAQNGTKISTILQNDCLKYIILKLLKYKNIKAMNFVKLPKTIENYLDFFFDHLIDVLFFFFSFFQQVIHQDYQS